MKTGRLAADAAEVQRFFAEVAAEINRPHYGDHARATLLGIVARAEAAGLYAPEALP